MQEFKRQVDFDEMDLPDTVYKYRIWKNPNHQTIITQRQVWFAQPSSFEDPLDCKIPIRYDLLTKEDIYSKYLHSSQEMHPEWSMEQHEEFASEWTEKSPMNDKDNLKEFAERSFREFDERFGVLSLTANAKSQEMWRVYSSNHSGFCIGYDPKIAFKSFGGGGEVRYLDELPVIMPTPKHSIEMQHFLQVFSKLKKWSFEEEYRAHKFHPLPATREQRTITLPTEAHKEIIFGANMDSKDKGEITAIAKRDFPHVLLLQATLNEKAEVIIEPAQ